MGFSSHTTHTYMLRHLPRRAARLPFAWNHATKRTISSTTQCKHWATEGSANRGSNSRDAFDMFEAVPGQWNSSRPEREAVGFPGRRVVVNEAERVAIWSPSGEVATVDGPCVKYLTWGHEVEPLRHYVAGADEFILVMDKDGTRSVKRGPASLWNDPAQHQHCGVYKQMSVSTNEALI